MDAIKLFHGEVSEDLLLKESQFEGLRTKLLKGAADFYGRLEGLLKGHADRESRAALGKAYDELGNLTATDRRSDRGAGRPSQGPGGPPGDSFPSRGADVASKLDVAQSLALRRRVAAIDRRHGRFEVIRGRGQTPSRRRPKPGEARPERSRRFREQLTKIRLVIVRQR